MATNPETFKSRDFGLQVPDMIAVGHKVFINTAQACWGNSVVAAMDGFFCGFSTQNTVQNSSGFFKDGVEIGLGSNVVPGGSNGSIQYNNSGAFGGDAFLIWDSAAKSLYISDTEYHAQLSQSGLLVKSRGKGVLGIHQITLNTVDTGEEAGFEFQSNGAEIWSFTKVPNNAFLVWDEIGGGPLFWADSGGGDFHVIPRIVAETDFYTGNSSSNSTVNSTGITAPYGTFSAQLNVAGNTYAAGIFSLTAGANSSAGVPQLTLDTQNTGQRAGIFFRSNGALKWELQSDTTDDLYVWNANVSAYAIRFSGTNNDVTLGAVGNAVFGNVRWVGFGNSSVNAHINSTGYYRNGSSIVPTPGGSNTHVQYNNSGAFQGTAGLTFTVTSNTLFVGGDLQVANNIYAFYSDKRLKTDFTPVQNALEIVKMLGGYYFHSNDLAASFGYKDTRRQVGVIAQEVQAVLPEAVGPAPFDTNPDGTSKSGENYLTVQYERLVPVLIEAVKSLTEENDKLKQDILDIKAYLKREHHEYPS